MARTRRARPGIPASEIKPPAQEVEGAETATGTEPPANPGEARTGSRERRRRELEERRFAAAAGRTDAAPGIPRPGAGAGGSPPVGSAARRRREAQERKAALARGTEPAGKRPRKPASPWLNSSQEDEVRDFIASQSAQMEQRKYQMSLIKDFLGDPSRFGISPGDIPTSTSPQEFAERRRELQYRIATIKTFLDLLSEELRLLEQAEAYARTNGSGNGS